MNRNPAISVRKAAEDDLDALVALECASFETDRISRAQWRRHVASDTACVLVAGPPGCLAGAAVVFHRRNSRRARLYSLAVAEASRGHGLAKALLTAAETEALRRGCGALDLEVRADNRAAITLYEQRGYRRAARLPAFYEDGADGWRYTRNLGKP